MTKVNRKLSIVTAVWNNKDTIKSCIESVQSQTYLNIEHVFIDGGSTDGTYEIIKNYKLPTDILISEKDKGIYDAMNKGLGLARGEIIGLLNSDDILYDNNVVKNIVNEFEKSDCDLLYGNIVFTKRSNRNIIKRKWRAGLAEPFISGWHPPHPSLYIRRKVIEICGFYNEGLEISADFEYMLRCFDVYNLKSTYLDKYIVKMSLGGVSSGKMSNILKGNLNCIKAFKLNNIKINVFLYILRRFIMKLKQYLYRINCEE